MITARSLLLFVALLGTGSRALLAAPPDRPNIVYILADDLGYGDLHALNSERGKIATPHLDRLAAEGMAFTDAHSGSSVCTPTRYGILTGRYAWRTRLQSGVLSGTDDPPLIAADRLTVPGLLRQHGYATACIGKWHLGFDSEKPPGSPPKENGQRKSRASGFGRGGLPVGSRISAGPTTRGFDVFFGCSNARTMSGLIENDRVIENLAPIEMLPRLEEQAVRYVGQQAERARGGQPFFLYLPLTAPHTPILPTPEWHGRSRLNDYGDFVMQVDAVVGSVLAALDKHGLRDNTLVVFTSDNGCSPQADTKELERKGHYPSAAYRGYKADIWDGGHRVPFLVRWPGKIAAGARSDQLTCLTDLVATCAELLGTELPDSAGEDSVSILPALLGQDTAPLREAVVHHSIHGKFAIRQGDWKLALCAGSGGWAKPNDAAALSEGLPEVQLYDLRSDPAEQQNVQAKHPQVVARLTALLESYVAAGRSTPGRPQQNDARIDLYKKTAGRVRKGARESSASD